MKKEDDASKRWTKVDEIIRGNVGKGPQCKLGGCHSKKFDAQCIRHRAMQQGWKDVLASQRKKAEEEQIEKLAAAQSQTGTIMTTASRHFHCMTLEIQQLKIRQDTCETRLNAQQQMLDSHICCWIQAENCRRIETADDELDVNDLAVVIKRLQRECDASAAVVSAAYSRYQCNEMRAYEGLGYRQLLPSETQGMHGTVYITESGVQLIQTKHMPGAASSPLPKITEEGKRLVTKANTMEILHQEALSRFQCLRTS